MAALFGNWSIVAGLEVLGTAWGLDLGMKWWLLAVGLQVRQMRRRRRWWLQFAVEWFAAAEAAAAAARPVAVWRGFVPWN